MFEKLEAIEKTYEDLTEQMTVEMGLDAEEIGKALQGALAKAARPILASARQLAPVKTGRLRSAIYSKRSRFSTPGFERRIIGVRRGKKAQKKDRDAYYWKWIEFGRGVVRRKIGLHFHFHGAVFQIARSGFLGKLGQSLRLGCRRLRFQLTPAALAFLSAVGTGLVFGYLLWVLSTTGRPYPRVSELRPWLQVERDRPRT